MYTSTRTKLEKHVSNCINEGLSQEGGLFINNNFQDFVIKEEFINYNYQEMAREILTFFLDDFTCEEIDEVINKAYNHDNFTDNLVQLENFSEISFLELYHGPTLAFKDMALTILPHLLDVSKRHLKDNKKTLILTATSGDTGGAALSGFSKSANTKIIVLYPTEGVSDFQERQMHYYSGNNAIAIAVEGNFDDCQTLVKKVFTSTNNLKNYQLSSANSINIGRLIPQVVYYFYSYYQNLKKGIILANEQINYVVPTGNFGNILACYIAKKMGLPINKIVCASNENKVLTDFFNTLTYNRKREFYLTNSPAMDILISSNLERLLYLITKDEHLVSNLMTDLKEQGMFKLSEKYQKELSCFMASNLSTDDTIKMIKEVYDQYNYLIDPHTAVGYGVYKKFKDELIGKTIIASTASPFKFIETIDEIFKTQEDGLKRIETISKKTNTLIPKVIYDIYNHKFNKIVWKQEDMEKKLRKLIGKIDESC